MDENQPEAAGPSRIEFVVYTPPQDYGPCLELGSPVAAQRHTRVDCPAEPVEGLYRARNVNRNIMDYGVLYPMAQVGQDEPTYCSKHVCPNDPRTDLFAILYPNPNSKEGNLKFFCPEHAYAPGSARSTSTTSRQLPRQTETPCPTCSMILPATGVCAYC